MKEFPDGKAGADDEGSTQIATVVDQGIVKMFFNKPMEWLGFDPESARTLARLLIAKADEAEAQRMAGTRPSAH